MKEPSIYDGKKIRELILMIYDCERRAKEAYCDAKNWKKRANTFRRLANKAIKEKGYLEEMEKQWKE